MSYDDMQRKSREISRLITAVDEYFKEHGPVPMKVLSQRFGKSLNKLGGFPETMDELRNDGTFHVQLQKSGAKLVMPGSAAPIDAAPLKKSG